MDWWENASTECLLTSAMWWDVWLYSKPRIKERAVRTVIQRASKDEIAKLDDASKCTKIIWCTNVGVVILCKGVLEWFTPLKSFPRIFLFCTSTRVWDSREFLKNGHIWVALLVPGILVPDHNSRPTGRTGRGGLWCLTGHAQESWLIHPPDRVCSMQSFTFSLDNLWPVS